MAEWLKNIDRELFFLINGSGNEILDHLMIGLSDKYIWIPLYLLIIYFLYSKYKLKFWIPLLILIACIGLADFITSGIMKPFFERMRPCRDTLISHQVDVVLKCGGKYGFASSHAANTMALGGFIHLIFKSRYSLILIFWAFMVSYSRIYLGVHYPADVITGMLIGYILAFLGIKANDRILK